MGRLIGSFSIGKVGSLPLLLTRVFGMGVVGVMGVSLNLGDFLTSCLAGVSVVVVFDGEPGLFLGDNLVAMPDPFFSTGVFDPRPDFSNGFSFFSFSRCFSLASATLFLFSAAGNNLSGSLPFFCLLILQRFESTLFLISTPNNSSPSDSFCSDQSRKFTFSILSINFPSGWMSSVVTCYVFSMCTPLKCFTVSPCICIFPSAKPARSARAAAFLGHLLYLSRWT